MERLKFLGCISSGWYSYLFIGNKTVLCSCEQHLTFFCGLSLSLHFQENPVLFLICKNNFTLDSSLISRHGLVQIRWISTINHTVLVSNWWKVFRKNLMKWIFVFNYKCQLQHLTSCTIHTESSFKFLECLAILNKRHNSKILKSQF